MTISSNVSFLAQTMSQSKRLLELRATVDDLQRQATTQKKYDDFSGFGADSFSLQRLRNQQPQLQSYLDNIDKVSNRIDLMTKSMSQITDIGNKLISAMQLDLQGGTGDIKTINDLAQQGLKFVQDLVNQDIDGQYIFGGSDVNNPPFVDENGLNSNFQNQIANWLAGTVTTAQLKTTTDGFTAANLGLSSGLAAAGSSTVHVDNNLDIDYTVKADQAGFQDIIRALTFAANLKIPDATTDVPTQAEFEDIRDHILTIAGQGVQEMDGYNTQLANKFNLIKAIKDNHTSDLTTVTTQIDKMENADLTTVLASLQAMQTQLTASYQVTKIVSDLSLVNFI